MVKLVMDGTEKSEEEAKLLPEEFKRWQEREPDRRPDSRHRTRTNDLGRDTQREGEHCSKEQKQNINECSKTKTKIVCDQYF